MPNKPEAITRKTLIALLNEDLSREFQAVIAYVVYSQTIKSAQNYLGGTPVTVPLVNYRQRVAQCEALGEYAIAEEVREILRTEQEHQIELATALNKEVPKLSAA
jgi:bacterioferritin